MTTWILLAALAAPAFADRVKVDLTDADVPSLARYENLHDLQLTGPYDSTW